MSQLQLTIPSSFAIECSQRASRRDESLSLDTLVHSLLRTEAPLYLCSKASKNVQCVCYLLKTHPQWATVRANFSAEKNGVAGESREWRIATDAVAPHD
jgi:hypothetical protein